MSEAEKYYREVYCLTPEEHPILGKKHHEVIEMMEDYAAEVVKNLTIPVVVGSALDTEFLQALNDLIDRELNNKPIKERF